MRSVSLFAVAAGAWAFSVGASADPGVAAEIAALRGEIAVLVERLDRLERAAAGAPPATSASPTAVAAPAYEPTATPAVLTAAGAVPTLRFWGDLRYRHESIDEAALTERHRQRIRGRFGLTADVSEAVRVGLTLATGGDDPVSANQTLGDGFSRKSIGVDRAYFAWQATDALTFTGGKIANPFFRPGDHPLVFDGDLSPEGLALRYGRGNWFANYAGFWVEERGAADDTIMLGGQVGYRGSLGNGMRLTAGVSYFDYLETRGLRPFWDEEPAGNRVDSAGGYLNDFNEAELFAEIGFTVGSHPITVFADYVTNTEADSADLGYAIGASFGEVTRAGTWRLGYAYQVLEADAVIGTFTDSDFGGGGTDNEGHVIDFSYGLRERLTLGLRYFATRRGSDSGNERDYDRLQADISFAY